MKGVLDFLFPFQCVGCDSFFGSRHATQFSFWCASCEVSLSYSTPIVRTIGDLYCISAVKFSHETVRNALHALKYSTVYGVASLTAWWMRAATVHIVQQFGEKQSIIFIPVPLHARRLAERGCNQAELIAEEIVQLANTQNIVCKSDILARSRYTKAQAKSAAAERATQLSNAFVAKAQLHANAVYVIIDDVVTTGATLQECARALAIAGARHIRALTVASA